MSTALQSVATAPVRLPPVPWRDPHTVSPARLSEHIEALELACRENPQSADLRTYLGMAYAMNFDAYKSMDALETARDLDPENYFAQLKYAELHYRLRALSCAEQETLRALDLAMNAWQAGLARKQLQEIRRLMQEGTQKPAWTKSLAAPAIAVVALAALLSLCVVWL